MAETRKLKVYSASGQNYNSVPSIVLKGEWLRKYGFNEGSLIQVKCEDLGLVISPRQPDPTPKFVEDIISSLTPKQQRILERYLQKMH